MESQDLNRINSVLKHVLEENVYAWKKADYELFGRQIDGYGVGDPFSPPEYETYEGEELLDALVPDVFIEDCSAYQGAYSIAFGFESSSIGGKLLSKNVKDVDIDYSFRGSDGLEESLRETYRGLAEVLKAETLKLLGGEFEDIDYGDVDFDRRGNVVIFFLLRKKEGV